MRALKLFCLCLSLLLLGTSPARADEAGDWQQLDGWLGKYPVDAEGKRIIRLIDQAPLRQMLGTLLPSSDRRRLATVLMVTSPVERLDGMLLAHQCRPHDCPNEHAMLVIDTTKREVWVGFFMRRGKVVSTRWYGTSAVEQLPRSVLEKFRRGHYPD